MSSLIVSLADAKVYVAVRPRPGSLSTGCLIKSGDEGAGCMTFVLRDGLHILYLRDSVALGDGSPGLDFLPDSVSFIIVEARRRCALGTILPASHELLIFILRMPRLFSNIVSI